MRFIQMTDSLSFVAIAPILAVFAALNEGLKKSLLLAWLVEACACVPPAPSDGDECAEGSLPSCEVRPPSMLDSLSEADSCLDAGVLVALLVTLCMEPYCEAVRRPSFEKNEPRLRGGAGVGGDDLVGDSGMFASRGLKELKKCLSSALSSLAVQAYGRRLLLFFVLTLAYGQPALRGCE